MVFILKEIGNLFFLFFFAETALAAVAGHKTSSAAELVDGEDTVIGASLAACHSGSVLKIQDFFHRQRRGRSAFLVTLSGDQSRAKRAHDTCDIRTYRFAAGNLLKATEDSVIIKSTSLYNHMVSKVSSIGNLNDLE